MSSQRRSKDRNQAANARTAARRGVPAPPSTPPPTSQRPTSKRPRNGRSWPITAIVGGIIVLVIVAMGVVKFVLPLTGSATAPSGSADAVSATVMQALTSVSDTTLNQVGQGTAQPLPISTGAPILKGASGHPLIVYEGAEYCPFCAAERWGLVVALSRFGKFSNLHTSRSASDDVYPSTPTFTFVGSTYQSDYIEFSPVEMQSNQRTSTGYATLQTPTAQQRQLLRTYDAPPYIAAQNAGSIPFLDLANQFIVSGSQFSPGSLDNRTWDQIAGNLNNPSTDDAKAIVGSANQITAAICHATGDTPANVCGQPAIKTLEAKLSAQAAPKAGQ